VLPGFAPSDASCQYAPKPIQMTKIAVFKSRRRVNRASMPSKPNPHCCSRQVRAASRAPSARVRDSETSTIPRAGAGASLGVPAARPARPG